MAIFAASRHVPEHLAEHLRTSHAQDIAQRLKDYYAYYFRFKPLTDQKRLIVTSPVPRVVETAQVYARSLGAYVLTESAFDDQKDPGNEQQMDTGAEILSTYLQIHELVFLVTHMPIVGTMFARTVMRERLHRKQMTVPYYTYGVHAIDLPRSDFFSCGQLGPH